MMTSSALFRNAARFGLSLAVTALLAAPAAAQTAPAAPAQPAKPPAPKPAAPAAQKPAEPAVSTPTIAFTGGKVYPVSGAPIENATVVIANGKITAVGAGLAPPAGAQVIDAKGKWITPGLINGATALGLVEVGSDANTRDNSSGNDKGVAAAFRAWDGLNVDSVLWAPARNEGVTTVISLPSGGYVSGQAAAVRTAGASRAEVVRLAPAAMVVNFGVDGQQIKSRGELVLRLRELLDDAREYAKNKAAFERAGTRDYAAGRLHLEALQPVLAGKLLVLVSADRADDIESALALAKEYRLKIAILGGAEGWKVADQLAAAKVPVLTTAQDNIPTTFSTLGARQENAALLHKAGVRVAMIVTEGETFNVRNIRQQAGNAVAYGLPWDEALRAVTLTPAEIYGLESTGTIAVGKDADLVVWSGDPFEFATRAEHVYVRGREVNGASRQDLLIERYKNPGKK